MTLPQGILSLAILNILLFITLLLFMGGLVPWRDYKSLPAPNQEWNETVSRLESDYASPTNKLSNKNVFRSRRSGTRIAQAVDSLGEYILSGASQDRAYFMHKRTNALVTCGVNEMFEGHKVTKITEHCIELERDGNAIQITF